MTYSWTIHCRCAILKLENPAIFINALHTFRDAHVQLITTCSTANLLIFFVGARTCPENDLSLHLYQYRSETVRQSNLIFRSNETESFPCLTNLHLGDMVTFSCAGRNSQIKLLSIIQGQQYIFYLIKRIPFYRFF